MRALADQGVPRLVELVVIIAQFGHMHQAFDVHAIECDEDAEIGDAGDGAFEFLADFILHVVALEPLLHITRGVVGAALGHGAMRAQRFPLAGVIDFLLHHGFDRAMH